MGSVVFPEGRLRGRTVDFAGLLWRWLCISFIYANLNEEDLREEFTF